MALSDGEESFLASVGERKDLNQYWFSQATIDCIVGEVAECQGRAALVSTPSIFFSLRDEIRARCCVFEYDEQWSSVKGFVFYDFNCPERVDEELRRAFDMVVIDPPYITRDVWEKYATTCRLLLRPGGRVLCTTIHENAPMMEELLGLHAAKFRPKIPNLVYQYSVYINYESARLGTLNPEVDDEDWAPAANARRDSAVQRKSPNEAPAWAELLSEPPAVPDPPEVEVLIELRDITLRLLQATTGINTPLQQAIRRRHAGDAAAAAAAAQAEAALSAAEAAATKVKDWLGCAGLGVLAEAMGEGEDAFALSVGSDRFRTAALAELVSRARGEGLADMEEYKAFALAGKRISSEISRQSRAVLDRIKALRRRARAEQ